MVMPAFRKFTLEAAIIGRLLAGYAELEIDLLHCVALAREDFDAVLKAMFRARGETRRIDVADALGRQLYHAAGLGIFPGWKFPARNYMPVCDEVIPTADCPDKSGRCP